MKGKVEGKGGLEEDWVWEGKKNKTPLDFKVNNTKSTSPNPLNLIPSNLILLINTLNQR